ncbi:hypothetical protein BDZ89DRAFT_1068138, partial [Hymenopellis radicata]
MPLSSDSDLDFPGNGRHSKTSESGSHSSVEREHCTQVCVLSDRHVVSSESEVGRSFQWTYRHTKDKDRQSDLGRHAACMMLV